MSSIDGLTPYQRHERDWKDCDRCPLSETRTRVVLVRGKLPCTVLFCGEAPGASEDVLGKPFVGPAGHLLDKIIEDSLGNVSYALTNLVGCIPLGDDGETKTAEPPVKSIEACAPRLREIVKISRPKLVVAVGKLSERWIPKLLPRINADVISITHPAAILRTDISSRGLMIQRTIVTLSDAVESL